jgi:hypothetical protein
MVARESLSENLCQDSKALLVRACSFTSSLCYESNFFAILLNILLFFQYYFIIIDDGSGIMRFNREDKLNYILKLAILNDSRLEFYPCWFDIIIT